MLFVTFGSNILFLKNTVSKLGVIFFGTPCTAYLLIDIIIQTTHKHLLGEILEYYLETVSNKSHRGLPPVLRAAQPHHYLTFQHWNGALLKWNYDDIVLRRFQQCKDALLMQNSEDVVLSIFRLWKDALFKWNPDEIVQCVFQQWKGALLNWNSGEICQCYSAIEICLIKVE